ncbi:hypothetical protein RJ641_035145 [Dillenia turbinata]|uniref:Uncharacterized protein n=1 Tax=Dillenia turbinata TaxID=194707 RepID=A0AAN8VIR3_9MAGN
MGLAGRFIRSMTGIDSMGGFHPSLDSILEGLGYAAPPIMALLFILDDEVVRLSPHAHAIRVVELKLIVAASSVSEELFYRASVQGALADIFLKGSDFFFDIQGMASLTGVLPPFVPFAQAFAAVISSALAAWYEERQMKRVYLLLLEGLLALCLGLITFLLQFHTWYLFRGDFGTWTMENSWLQTKITP